MPVNGRQWGTRWYQKRPQLGPRKLRFGGGGASGSGFQFRSSSGGGGVFCASAQFIRERERVPVPALVAPYCAIPRDCLSDTPLSRAMGLLVSQHGQLGAIPPPLFLSISPLESMQSGGAIPPPSKGVSQRYLRDTL